MGQTLVDLSSEIYQNCPTLPNHPHMVITEFQSHDTIRESEGVKF